MVGVYVKRASDRKHRQLLDEPDNGCALVAIKLDFERTYRPADILLSVAVRMNISLISWLYHNR